MAIRTYTVGDNSGVKRLDELTGLWQSVPLNLLDSQGQDLNIILYDVMTDPLDANKVFVCGQRAAYNGNPGIFWSANGGVTWNKCVGDVAGTVNQGSEITELWVVDSNVIYATSDCGYVFKSTDGGVTFNHTAANPGDVNPAVGWFAGNCELRSKAIHFINANVGVVIIGYGSGYMFKTTDGGASWIFAELVPLSVSNSVITGVHMSTDQQVIHVLNTNGIWVSNDGGISFDQRLSARLLHLSSISWLNGDDSQLWAYGQQGGRYQTVNGGTSWVPLQAQGANQFSDRAGHHYSTVAPNDGFFAENADIFFTSDSSLTGTLSEANQFSGGIQAVWTGLSDEQQTIPGCTDPTATNFNPLANADCAGVVGGNDLSCCTYEPGPPPEQPCECPVGYTYNESTNECELTETTPANCLPDTYTVRDGDQSPSYSSNGTNFYPDVTTLPWPLSDIIAPANPNVNNLQDAALTPLIAIQNITSPLWGGFGPGGRLFDAGVWANEGVVPNGQSAPLDEWIGFTACVDVPTTGTYSLGFAGDNRVRIKLNGVPLVEVGANGGIYSYTYWSVIELTLPVGNNIIEIEGFNQASTGGNPASFAAEIYSANVATLMAMTSKPELDTVTIWSTFDFIGKEFDLGERSGCSCPEGYALSNCDGQLICVRTDIVPATPCNCYLATNCEDPANTELITIDPSLPPLDLNATYVFEEFGDKCWTIESSDDCGSDPGDVILLNTGFIDANDTLGVQGDQDFNWKTVEDPAGSVFPVPAILPDQNWWPTWGTLPPAPSAPQALWIAASYPTHSTFTPATYAYELEFTLPVGFVPNLQFSTISDNAAKFYLNGNLIGDNGNPAIYPSNWSIPYSFGTSNPAHFIPQTAGGPQVLRVEVIDANGNNLDNTSTGFALMGTVESLALPDPSTLVTVHEVFIDCDNCLGTCYRLVDCENLIEPIYTSSIVSGDLTEYVGQVIRIATCPETCWQLEEIQCPLDGIEVIEITNSFPDCVTCLPSDPPPPPLVIRNRTVKPGYNTKGCSTEYVEKISCDFSEAMFQQAASRRYGIKFCCAQDLDDLDIKKQLMDFKMITDPDACVASSNLCCEPCNVVAELITFTPLSCPAPSNVQATLVSPNPPVQPNCTDVSLTAGKADPATPHDVVGVDCCGIPFTIQIFHGQQPVQLCVDLDQPFTYDPNVIVISGGNCDCDPNPPFDCFCIVPTNAIDNPPGNFSGNLCDGTPFDMEVLPDVSYEPICVRADGSHTKSDWVTLQNLGDCTDDGVCDPLPICTAITYLGQPADPGPGGGNVSGLLCNGTPFNIDLASGESSGVLCIQQGTVVITGNINQFVSPSPCT